MRRLLMAIVVLAVTVTANGQTTSHGPRMGFFGPAEMRIESSRTDDQAFYEHNLVLVFSGSLGRCPGAPCDTLELRADDATVRRGSDTWTLTGVTIRAVKPGTALPGR